MFVGDLLDQATLIKQGWLWNCLQLCCNCRLGWGIEQAFWDGPDQRFGKRSGSGVCRKVGVQRYICASTVYVYSRDGGFTAVASGSRTLCWGIQRSYGLDYTILRYGSLYGPRSDHRNGLWRIVKNALETSIVKYEGSPESLREYIHVEDAAKASVDALRKEFCNEHLVLTGHEPMRVLDLLEMLREILGFSKTRCILYLPSTGHYVASLLYQPKLGRKYTPPLHVDLGQGLLELIEEVQQSRQASTPE